MSYIPNIVKRALFLRDVTIQEANKFNCPVIVRRLKLESYKFKQEGFLLLLYVDGFARPLAIPSHREMRFGSQTVTARDYLVWALEKGDLIDVVLWDPSNNDQAIEIFWIHIEYKGNRKEAGFFSDKEDGLFALRTKSGEKAERIVARQLKKDFGHSFTPSKLESSGYFEIRYKDKTKREPDLICSKCGLTVEVKKRNRDEHFRISHSSSRTFKAENLISSWHAFVFPDMKARFVSNDQIYSAIDKNSFVEKQDKYDKWLQINKTSIQPVPPPKCN